MSKEEEMLKKRLTELSRQAYSRDIVVFSDFLNLNERNILHTIPKNMLYTRYETYGGYPLAERQMAVFLPDALYYEYLYPMEIIEVHPVNARFSEDLSHRDYLGALMNLGIERCKIGDILIDEEKAAFFVKSEIADYVADHLTRIRHTSVRTVKKDLVELDYTPRFETIKGTVPSVRLDTVLSVAWPLSRSRLTAYIEAGKVFVNGRLITSNGYHLKNGDILSVRGLGRIIFDEVLSETKKGRYLILVRKYL